jgi:hypothetical protein
MTTEQPFTPDDPYCVYCHAPAAGPCATCGALCCGDCVELVMGLTTRRAVCCSCIEKGHLPAGAWTTRRIAWAGAALLVVLGVGACLLLWA